MTIEIMAWIAMFLLASSYWLQIVKIHKHKEVRDLSVWTYIFLLCGYSILAVKATSDFMSGSNSWFWIVRQVATMLPVSIVLWQIFRHKQARWHDDDDPFCKNCKKELEPDWKYCPFCSYWAEKEELP